MKVLITGWYHTKNYESLIKSCEILGWERVYNMFDADTIFSGDTYFDTRDYPKKRFIFGPHFCVIPNNTVRTLNNDRKNAVYIQPSLPPIQMWISEYGVNNIPLKVYPFGVDTDRFCPNNSIIKSEVFIYYKRRDPKELEFLVNFLNKIGVTFRVLEYGKYTENEYIDLLDKSVYGIWLGSHESQGFALQEALSMGVPLLVWSTTLMKQEYGSTEYNDIKTVHTSTPYWSPCCGEVFCTPEQLENTWKIFQSKLPDYDPRTFITTFYSIKCRAKALQTDIVDSIDLD